MHDFFLPGDMSVQLRDQLKYCEIGQTVFLQYDECLALWPMKVLQRQTNTLWRENCVFFHRSKYPPLKRQSSTFQLNNSFVSWLRFWALLCKETNEKMASVLSRQIITYIYTTESLTINIDEVCHYITDYYQAWLFSEHWNSLQAVSCRPGEFYYLMGYQLHQIINLTSRSDIGKAWSFSFFLSCPSWKPPRLPGTCWDRNR